MIFKRVLISRYYDNISNLVNVVAGYVEDPDIKKIIHRCRLKPYKLERLQVTARLENHWVDEYGNSLYIKNKNYFIVENDLKINKHDIISTDLYANLPLDSAVKISNFAHVSYGEDEDSQDPCMIITLLGIDNHYRTYVYYDNFWERYSPLSLGVKNLKKIISNEDIKTYKIFKDKEVIIYPCNNKIECVLSLPAHKVVWEETELDKNIFNFLGEV